METINPARPERHRDASPRAALRPPRHGRAGGALSEPPMSVSARAGKPAEPSDLANVPRLVTAYYALRPDPAVPAQRVAFGTSGHRGAALDAAFNEAHILAITQAICRLSAAAGIDGPLFLGIDTHALSEPAFATRARGARGERGDRPHRRPRRATRPLP